MRTIIGILFFATLGWFGYWFIGSTAHEKAATAWLEERRSKGWVADYTDLTVEGFPNRFDTTISDMELVNPRSGWAWKAPFFQVLSLSYKPNHFIAVWPPEQTVSTPHQKFTITNDDMRGSLVFEANTSLELERSTITLKNLKISTSDNQSSSIESAVLASRQSETRTLAHDIAFDANNFTPSAAIKKWLDPKSILPSAFETLTIKTTAGFDVPWNRIAIEGSAPNLTYLGVETFDAKWGELQIQATGALDVDGLGYPTGKLALRAKNWKDMIQLAVSSGTLKANTAKSLETGLGLIALLSGNKDTLDVPLSFANRVMSIGPIPIGKAPRLKRN